MGIFPCIFNGGKLLYIEGLDTTDICCCCFSAFLLLLLVILFADEEPGLEGRLRSKGASESCSSLLVVVSLMLVIVCFGGGRTVLSWSIMVMGLGTMDGEPSVSISILASELFPGLILISSKI